MKVNQLHPSIEEISYAVMQERIQKDKSMAAYRFLISDLEDSDFDRLTSGLSEEFRLSIFKSILDYCAYESFSYGSKIISRFGVVISEITQQKALDAVSKYSFIKNKAPRTIVEFISMLALSAEKRCPSFPVNGILDLMCKNRSGNFIEAMDYRSKAYSSILNKNFNNFGGVVAANSILSNFDDCVPAFYYPVAIESFAIQLLKYRQRAGYDKGLSSIAVKQVEFMMERLISRMEQPYLFEGDFRVATQFSPHGLLDKLHEMHINDEQIYQDYKTIGVNSDLIDKYRVLCLSLYCNISKVNSLDVAAVHSIRKCFCSSHCEYFLKNLTNEFVVRLSRCIELDKYVNLMKPEQKRHFLQDSLSI